MIVGGFFVGSGVGFGSEVAFAVEFIGDAVAVEVVGFGAFAFFGGGGVVGGGLCFGGPAGEGFGEGVGEVACTEADDAGEDWDDDGGGGEAGLLRGLIHGAPRRAAK